MVKRIFKWIAIILGVLIAGLFVAGLIIHKPRPNGKAGPEADALAQKMLQAIDKEAWDTTRFVQWKFSMIHEYLWDKEQNKVIIKWDDKKVILNTQNQQGKVWEGGAEITGKKADKLLGRAWFFFCNDSFWLNAPAKVFDPGTERQIVQLENGEEALLVSYTSGGVTPGDSYLWILDETGRPKSWKMWVKIIPVGGIESSWSGWQTLGTGAQIATIHKTAGVASKVTDLAAGNTLEALGITDTPFD